MATEQPAQVEPDFKGMVGLGLIGAELGFAVPALAGMEGWWPYVVFPVVGAGGGGAAGYFLLEQGSGSTGLAVGALTLGMVLIIPTMVVTLSATAYDPEDEPTVLPAAARGGPPAVVTGRERAALRAGPGLVRCSPEGVFMAPPAVALTRNMDREQAERIGVRPTREWRLTVLSGRF